jgi:hypothetical protein
MADDTGSVQDAFIPAAAWMYAGPGREGRMPERTSAKPMTLRASRGMRRVFQFQSAG